MTSPRPASMSSSAAAEYLRAFGQIGETLEDCYEQALSRGDRDSALSAGYVLGLAR